MSLKEVEESLMQGLEHLRKIPEVKIEGAICASFIQLTAVAEKLLVACGNQDEAALAVAILQMAVILEDIDAGLSRHENLMALQARAADKPIGTA